MTAPMDSSPDRSAGLSYADAGVDVEAGERAVALMKASVAKASRPEVVGGLGGFAGLFDASALRTYRRPLLATATDGVGTKVAVAQAMDRHDTVGQDLVAMVVDDLVVTGAEPLFLTDYIATGQVVPEQIAELVAGIAEGCRIAGCALLGGETAEHPGLMAPGEYDLAAAGTAVVEADEVLGPHRVEAGDALIAMASSGLHANGFSLARAALLGEGGPGLAAMPVILEGRSIGEELLVPTRIYAKDALALAADPQVAVHAFSHITGGGLAANIARVLPADLIAEVDRNTWRPLPVFDLIRDTAGVDRLEMERTFNMGIGMVAVVAAGSVDRALRSLEQRGVPAWACGQIRRRASDDRGDSAAKGGAGGLARLVGNYAV